MFVITYNTFWNTKSKTMIKFCQPQETQESGGWSNSFQHGLQGDPPEFRHHCSLFPEFPTTTSRLWRPPDCRNISFNIKKKNNNKSLWIVEVAIKI